MLFYILILIIGVVAVVSERLFAWRWLRAETSARRERFLYWAALTVLHPILGVALYLFFRSHGRLLVCPHCQVPSPANRAHCLHCDKAWDSPGAQDQEFLSWQLPNHAVIPLAAIAALVMTTLTLTTGLLWLYQREFLLPAATVLIVIGGTFAVSIGVWAWFLVKTQRAVWQDNPLPFLVGVTLALVLAAVVRFYSGLALMFAAAILSLGTALVVSAMIHLVRYDVGRSVIGLTLGYIIARVAHVIATPLYGLHGGFRVMGLCIAPFMLVVAILSARARFGRVPKPHLRIKFLHVATPFWGLLGISLVLSFFVIF